MRAPILRFPTFLLPAVWLALTGAAPAFGWGCEAHQMIALTARRHMTPAASRAVDELLNRFPMDANLKRFCRDRQEDVMADSASWADDVRLKLDDPWHFIDISLTVLKPVADLTPWCSPIDASVRGGQASGCVTNAIDFNRKILEDRNRPGAERADALRFLIHFFGDITQPLHNVSDTGGNCSSVRFFDQERPTNIHSMWDSGILTHVRNERKVSSLTLFNAMDLRFARMGKAWMKAKADPAAWSWEAHRIGVQMAYGLLSPQIPASFQEEGNCDAERARVAELNIQVGNVYVNRVWPVMESQMMKSAYRLAGYLNGVFRD
jgi:hypothetical protein